MLQATVRRSAVFPRGAEHVYEGYTPWQSTAAACLSKCRQLSMMTPSDLICDTTGRRLPATSTVVTAAADLSWAEVPSITTSDLSAFNCRWFSRNHCLTASEQRTSRSSASVVFAGSIHGDVQLQIVSKMAMRHKSHGQRWCAGNTA